MMGFFLVCKGGRRDRTSTVTEAGWVPGPVLSSVNVRNLFSFTVTLWGW